MSLVKEFKEFTSKGNVVDLAVGVVIGAAFGKIVSSFVADIMMPLINPLIVGGDWRNFQIGNGIKIGNFLGMVLDFIIVAFAVFMMVKGINRMKKKQAAEEAPAPEPPPGKQELLLMEIRDLLKKQ